MNFHRPCEPPLPELPPPELPPPPEFYAPATQARDNRTKTPHKAQRRTHKPFNRIRNIVCSPGMWSKPLGNAYSERGCDCTYWVITASANETVEQSIKRVPILDSRCLPYQFCNALDDVPDQDATPAYGKQAEMIA